MASALVAALPTAGVAEGCALVSRLAAFRDGGEPPDGASCGTYVAQAGGAGVSCHWAYSYRDDAANRKADALWAALQGCRAGETKAPEVRVNHPDSHALREWVVGADVYRVSVKDKGARGQTFVFFALERF